MRLYVYVLEGRDLVVQDSFVKLRLGKFKSRTRVLKNTKNPIWNEEFAFRVHSLDDDELIVSVYNRHDESTGFFNNGFRDLVGRVRIPLWSVANEENHHLPPTWFSIENHKSDKSITKESGKILLALSLHGRGHDVSLPSIINNGCNEEQHDDIQSPKHNSNIPKSPKKMIKAIAGRFEKLFSKHDDSSSKYDSSDLPTTSSDNGDSTEEPTFTTTFEESMEAMESADEETEPPENLHGGVLIDETYVIPPKDLNHLLFAPDSQFWKDLADLQGTTDVHESPWTWDSDKMLNLTRTVTFRVELLYKITNGYEIEGEETSRIIISWGINFLQSTMMKGMIESGAKQGLKESFDQFARLLGQKVKPVNQSNVLDKDQTLVALENDHQSDWELAVGYFCNFTVISTVFMVAYVFVHIVLCGPKRIQGLEFYGLELPGSFGEFVTCGVIFFNLERVYFMVERFVQARLRRGNDHGVKAQGEGWVLTVALIEGTKLAPLDSSSFSDPYVVFTCNGKTRTSSVKLQTLDPQWNDILEFDAAEEPPSLLDVEVFDFDGPFGQPASLGHAEVRFLRHTSEELADMWVPLEGKLAQSFQSKLHLRIFLDNNNGVETIKEYLTKVEKEAGKKLNVKSPHRNSTFQKLFSLPPEEFLISDFSCSLKRKLPLQGRLFVSSRIIGFYANLFGHKTRFSFLWEDVEDIHILPPSISSVGSPILVMVLHKGRGVDARHGAKSQDEEGRLHFYFHSFVSFNSASRTIMALWRTRSSSMDQKIDTVEDYGDGEAKMGWEQNEENEKCLYDDVGSHLVVEDEKMSKVYSTELPFSVESMMEIFRGGNLEHKVMVKLSCLNYTATNWEPTTAGSDIYERRLCYKFNRRVSSFGGDVTSTQQKSPINNVKGWIVTEAMSLHDVPFGDHFYVQVKYEVRDGRLGWCTCDVYVGVVWLKSCNFEERITRNIIVKFGDRVREMIELVEREILLAIDSSSL